MPDQVDSAVEGAGATTVQPTSLLPHLMFFQPRLPGNTGSAVRLAAVTGARLHLIEPLGFDLDEAKLRRAGLDYHDLATVEVHRSLDAALETLPDARVFAFVTRASTVYTEVVYRPDDVLLFGPETADLSDDVLVHPRISGRVTIPMVAAGCGGGTVRAGRGVRSAPKVRERRGTTEAETTRDPR